jgi:16S rRNA (guanine(1405)-N(7))-methyltransferase
MPRMPETSEYAESATLDGLTAAVAESGKYYDVCPALIRSIGARELAARRSLKEAIKATKNKLHQVGAAYWETRPHYEAWLRELESAAQGNGEGLRAACARIMSQHASSRERLPYLADFYAQTLQALAPVRSVLDIACGLNPLSIPWMPLAEDARYYAYDIYEGLMDFTRACLRRFGVAGNAACCDVLSYDAYPETDVALLLKAIPCLEQLDKGAVPRLLESVPARCLVVSFPAHSLGGRDKGMPTHYEAHLHDLIRDKGWQAQRLLFASELVFVLTH